MTTPILDFLRQYCRQNPMRLHMPGHKGALGLSELDPAVPWDITEIPGADSLFQADGIIAQSEQNAAALYKTAHSFYACAGSTLGIQTMLFLMAREGRQIVAARGVHRAFLGACALLDLPVHWVYPQSGSVLSGCYDPEDFAAVLKRLDGPGCVYLTSPDYLGHMADIPAFAAMCQKYGARLLVDNAHGAHLAFLPDPCHPIALGADFCCDSAHKMLPGLTGTAYLHVRRPADADPAIVRNAMATFASTSPSYLMLASLDWCNVKLADPAWRRRLADAVNISKALRRDLAHRYRWMDGDPLHLTIDARASGCYGQELAEHLARWNIVAEYADAYHVVLLLSAAIGPDQMETLRQALLAFTPQTPPPYDPAPLPQPTPVCSLRQATLAPQKMLPIDACAGRICGAGTVPCPPGVAIVAPGERIDAAVIAACRAYGILSLRTMAHH